MLKTYLRFVPVFIFIFALLAPAAGFGEEPVLVELDPSNSSRKTGDNYPKLLLAKIGSDESSNLYPIQPLKSEWGMGIHKSYTVPALEIIGLDALINGYNRLTANDKDVYKTTFSTFWENAAHGHWQLDEDNFRMNQLLHPYHGSLYHGFARSAGLNFWESMGYTIAGSFLWETAGETLPPSINDMVATGIGGTFFGEALFRMAGLLLEEGGEKPGFWRELAAAIVSPPTGFNRLAFGDRFKPVFPSHVSPHFWRISGGVVLNVNLKGGDITTNPEEITANYEMSYGLPGKPGYTYTRPFDYFRFEVASLNSKKNPLENVMVHGLLIGKEYEGDSYRGIWGLYGSYDYISPHFFRVSTTAASMGTTYQKWLSPSVAAQGTFLAGLGFGSGGTTAGSGERDYHYGLSPQGLASFRLIFGNTAALDATVRGYWVSEYGASEKGTEKIVRGNVGLIVRIYDRHAIGVQYVGSRRDAHYPGLSEIEQRSNTFSLMYTLLRDKSLGAVEWRNVP